MPLACVEWAVRCANTAPGGAHHQPRKFVAVADATLRHRIRVAAEAEEQLNYDGGRMPPAWREALGATGHQRRQVLPRRRTVGLATPNPMAFLSEILGRPSHERPVMLFPVGYPAHDCEVPVLARKPLEQALEVVGSPQQQ